MALEKDKNNVISTLTNLMTKETIKDKSAQLSEEQINEKEKKRTELITLVQKEIKVLSEEEFQKYFIRQDFRDGIKKLIEKLKREDLKAILPLQ